MKDQPKCKMEKLWLCINGGKIMIQNLGNLILYKF